MLVSSIESGSLASAESLLQQTVHLVLSNIPEVFKFLISNPEYSLPAALVGSLIIGINRAIADRQKEMIEVAEEKGIRRTPKIYSF